MREEPAATISELGQAIANKDWTAARKLWAQLAEWHPMLFEHNPNFRYIAEVLRNQETMVRIAGRLSKSIH